MTRFPKTQAMRDEAERKRPEIFELTWKVQQDQVRKFEEFGNQIVDLLYEFAKAIRANWEVDVSKEDLAHKTKLNQLTGDKCRFGKWELKQKRGETGFLVVLTVYLYQNETGFWFLISSHPLELWQTGIEATIESLTERLEAIASKKKSSEILQAL